jgi:hypothetical protein
MAKVLESYLYGDPAETLDRKRASEAARAKRKIERDAERAAQRSGLTNGDLKLIPSAWLVRK